LQKEASMGIYLSISTVFGAVNLFWNLPKKRCIIFQWARNNLRWFYEICAANRFRVSVHLQKLLH